jgi:soluble lytic murein transglycosylase-like protein
LSSGEITSAPPRAGGARFGVTVPVDVVLAIVMKESSGNPQAKRTEPDGRISRGLMQVLEGTARELGVANPLTLFQPTVGIDAGVHYFAKQLRRYGSNVGHAIAAYNAGTAYVGKATGKYKNQSYVTSVLKWLEQLKSPGQATAPAGRAAQLVPVVLIGAAIWAATRNRQRMRAAA